MRLTIAESAPVNRLFTARIAVFNTLMLSTVLLTDHHTRVLLAQESGKDVSFPLGGYCIPIFIFSTIAVNLLVLKLARKHPYMIVLMPLLATAGIGMMVNTFHFETPAHLYRILGFSTFPIPGVLVAVVRFLPIDEAFTDDRTMATSAKLDWINQYAGLWKTIAFTALTLLLAFCYYWLSHMTHTSEIGLKESGHLIEVQSAYAAQIVLFGLYCVTGPILESYFRVVRILRLLHKVPETGSTPAS